MVGGYPSTDRGLVERRACIAAPWTLRTCQTGHRRTEWSETFHWWHDEECQLLTHAPLRGRAGATAVNECRGAGQKRRRSPVVGPVREKRPIGLNSRAASYTADKANHNPSGSYTRDANRGNNDTEWAGR
jgi:hypothetical protein